jgi:hypothetical protein
MDRGGSAVSFDKKLKLLPGMSMSLGEPSRGCTCFSIRQVLKDLNSQCPDVIANIGQLICSHLGRGESCAPNSRSRGYEPHSSSFTVDASFTPSSSSSSSFELKCVMSRFVCLMMFIPIVYSLVQKVARAIVTVCVCVCVCVSVFCNDVT